MPELPEVETIRRGLEYMVVGRMITRIRVRNVHLRWPVKRSEMRKAQSRRVLAVKRRAKYLLLELDDHSHLVIHLGMSGRLSVAQLGEPLLKHDHVIFCFDNGLELRFNDTRRFGMVKWFKPGALEEDRLFRNLGLEPLAPDFTKKYLVTKAARRTLPIKNFLMDSRVVVGLGNIYTNEALHRAGINPLRAAGTLESDEWGRVRNAVRRVLREAIMQGGTTLSDTVFRNADGELGYFQIRLRVYDRAGEPCPNCGTPIERVTQSGRSTFFCARCQK